MAGWWRSWMATPWPFLTVKLDRERYEALKTFGVKLNKKSQKIFVEALDLYLQQTAQSA